MWTLISTYTFSECIVSILFLYSPLLPTTHLPHALLLITCADVMQWLQFCSVSIPYEYLTQEGGPYCSVFTSMEREK